MGIVQANSISVAYETKGDPGGIPLVLVHGLGMQLVGWPDELLDLLARRGHHVIVFNNRDAGAVYARPGRAATGPAAGHGR